MRATETGSTERVFRVDELTRVEGEGSLRIRVRSGEVVEARLAIFEPPRYFERLVVNRTPDEVIDIVARICGICPVAYQMSAVHAFESLFGVTIDPAVRSLRRLMYCGEWIESHALHIYLLHAPDFLGYPSALAMAVDHREIVERGLAMKRVGNRLLALLGGRAIHPVSVRVGGFSKVPTKHELETLRPELEAGLAAALETVKMTASFATPSFDREPMLVSMRHPAEYPFNEGRIVSSDGLDLALDHWDDAFHEEHIEGSNALHARTNDGRIYLLGPAARITLAGDQLHPLAAEALVETGLKDAIRTNIYSSIVGRAVELVHAFAEAIEIIDGYAKPDEPRVHWTSKPGRAAWATEAPRGMLFHRYVVDDAGRIAEAQIVPPTSQNQGAIEEDLTRFVPTVLDLPQDVAQVQIEQLVRSYDPCISCATHFIDLKIDREP